MAYEELDLPVFRRYVAVTHEGGESRVDGTRHGVRRILRQFSGVLGAGVAVGDWPAPTLSHLTLDRLAATALEGSERGRRSSVDESGATVDSEPESDEDAPEPRVLDVIRNDSGRSGETRPGTDPGRFEAAGRPGRDELGVVVDLSNPDDAVGTEEPILPDDGQSPADDRTVVDRPSSDEADHTEQTVRREQSIRSEQTVRREVVRHEESGRPRADESSARADRSGTDEARVVKEPVEGRPERGPGDDGRSVVPGDHPVATGSDVDPRESSPAQAPPSVAEAITGQWGVPSMIVSRSAPMVTSTRRSQDSAQGRQRSGPRRAQDPPEDRTAPVDRPRRDAVPSRPGSTQVSDDGSVRMEPLRTATRAVGGTASTDVGPTAATARTVDGPGDTGPTKGPRMTVRRDDGDGGGSAGDDPGVDRPVAPTDATDAAGSPTGQSPRGNADREGTSDTQWIDDLLDVDRLVDRLSRAFERKARIERERRGR